MFNDIQDKIDNFLDLPDSQEQEVAKIINSRIRQNTEGFRQYMLQLDFDMDSPREVFYEVLWSNPIGLDDIIFNELIILIDAVEQGIQDAHIELSSMMYLTELKGMTDKFYTDTLHLLTNKLSSTNPAIRRQCGEAMVSIHDEYKPMSPQQIEKLQSLLHDPNFKTKVNIYADLRDVQLVPNGFKFTFLEKIKAKLMGYGKFIN